MFIYLDESGDLGFDFQKRKTTQKFIITKTKGVAFTHLTKRISSLSF